jgi:hypothetical protein
MDVRWHADGHPPLLLEKPRKTESCPTIVGLKKLYLGLSGLGESCHWTRLLLDTGE